MLDKSIIKKLNKVIEKMYPLADTNICNISKNSNDQEWNQKNNVFLLLVITSISILLPIIFMDWR